MLLLATLVGCSESASNAEREADGCLYGSVTAAIRHESVAATTPPTHFCGPRPPATDGDGRADCEVLVMFPAPRTLDAGVEAVPARCDELPGLRDTGRVTADGAPICEVLQVVRRNREFPAGEEGWFFVVLSEEAMALCLPGDVIFDFSPGVRVPSGSEVSLACEYVVRSETETERVTEETCPVIEPAEGSGEALSREVGQACDPGSGLESFDDREVLVTAASSQCSSGNCLVFQLLGSTSFRCGGDGNQCALNVDDHIYCTCRCSVPDGVELDPGELCSCPKGFTCVDGLFSQPDALAGGYCVVGTF